MRDIPPDLIECCATNHQRAWLVLSWLLSSSRDDDARALEEARSRLAAASPFEEHTPLRTVASVLMQLSQRGLVRDIESGQRAGWLAAAVSG